MLGFIQKLLNRVFNVREGELERTLLMQLNIFLIITTLLMVKPTVNGLFLAEVGVERLPLVYILVAIFAVLISNVYNRLLSNVSFLRLMVGTLSVSVFVLALFAVLLRLPLSGNWVYYAFYIWSTIFGVLAASQFWILANMLFNVREAKRLFGLISVGAISGGVFGGYLTALLANFMGAEQQVFVAAALLLPSIWITHHIWRKYISGQQTEFQRKKKIPKGERPLRLILSLPHLTYLSAIILVSVVVAKLVDYQFSAIAASRISDPDELTAFFGFWFSNFNIVSLLIQLFLTQRLVGTLGIGKALLIQPTAILLGAITLFFFPVIGVVIFLKMSDSSLKQSLNKATFELLSLPIPARIKGQTKTYIDVVVDSVATGIGGLLLIFMVQGLELSTVAISLIILGLVVVWLFLIRRIRETYLHAFRTQLLQSGHQETLAELPNRSILEDLEYLLLEGDEAQVLSTVKKLEQEPDSRLAPALFRLLDQPSAAVREGSLRALYYVPQADFEVKIRSMVNAPVRGIRSAAISYLLTHTEGDRREIAAAFLEDEDEDLRLAALVGIARESRNNLVLQETFQLRRRLSDLFDELEQMEVQHPAYAKKAGAGLKAVGLAALLPLYPNIQQFLNSKLSPLRGEAIRAAGLTLEPTFIAPLLRALGQADFTEPARQSLLAYGTALVPELETYVRSKAAHPDTLVALPALLAEIGSQRSIDLLFELANQADRRLRRASLPALSRAKSRAPHLRFPAKAILRYILQEARVYRDTLSILYVQRNLEIHSAASDPTAALSRLRAQLIERLEKRLDAHIEGIFHLLRLKYKSSDIEFIYQHLGSQTPETRISAIEYLDNILEPNLKQVIIPIVETAQLDAITEKVIRTLKGRIPEEEECYELLMLRDDPPLNQIVQEIRQLLLQK